MLLMSCQTACMPKKYNLQHAKFAGSLAALVGESEISTAGGYMFQGSCPFCNAVLFPWNPSTSVYFTY